jgi:hypothetical protein
MNEEVSNKFTEIRDELWTFLNERSSTAVFALDQRVHTRSDSSFLLEFFIRKLAEIEVKIEEMNKPVEDTTPYVDFEKLVD